MYDKNNIFARIIRGEVPCHKVYEDDKLLAFKDINPKAKVHVIVVPKGEYKDFVEFSSSASSANFQYFFQKVNDIAKDLGIKESGYRVLTNIGPDATQTIFHFHIHILGGELLNAF